MYLLERGGVGRDGFGMFRVGWPVGDSKVEKVHRGSSYGRDEAD